ncbi:MAG: hypothetical protein LUD82_06280 [Clostridiales bacterium]|nr:hypothetical protein [Clostridiales bacterium]MCD8127061.1 hypothetical protein [Clostridiales bacterium]
MGLEDSRTIGYICPKCHKSVVVDKDMFTLTSAPVVVPCPCGGSRLIIEYTGDQFKLNAPCVACGNNHTVYCSARDFRTRRGMAFSCKKTGLDCCYVGEEGVVYDALTRLEARTDQLEAAQDAQGSFLNELVMTEMLDELKDIAQRGGISCTCGSKEWQLRLHYSAIEVICSSCGNALRLPAATMDDLGDLCCKQTLLIQGR